MFHIFEQETLLLQETMIDQFEEIYVGNQYTAKLTMIKQRKIKQFIQYSYKLEINKDSKNVLILLKHFWKR